MNFFSSRKLVVAGSMWAFFFGWLLYAQTESKPFSHKNHFNQHNTNNSIKDCTDCHQYNPKVQLFVRPYHDDCSGCHNQVDFKKTTTSETFCSTCHVGQSSLLKPSPDTRKGFVSLKNFSHDKHLNTDKVVFSTFGRLLCDSCHSVNQPSGKAGLPGHEECSLCHGESAGPKAVKPLLTSTATMSDCIGCHADARVEDTSKPARERSFQENAFGSGAYAGDLLFSHQQHLTHSSEQSCQSCHQGVAADTEGKTLHLPDMFSCAECHDDTAKVPAEKSMSNCQLCHRNIRQGEKPAPDQHYGNEDHYAGSVQQKVQSQTAYCGWCHAKDPSVFAIKKRYTRSVEYYCGKEGKKKKKKFFTRKPELCVACHTAEQIDETPPKLCQ